MSDIKNALLGSKNGIVVGFNIFGYEDAKAVIAAAERANTAVLLMTNRDASRILDIAHWGALLGSMAKASTTTVGVHLDHCSDIETIKRAIDSGYTSVMYDGSKLPIEENIKNSQMIAEYAHAKGVIVEGEIGDVPYSDMGNMTITYTSLEDMEKYSARANTDTIAVSVGNIHRLAKTKVRVNFELVEKLQAISDKPMVIHGASGLTKEDLQKLKTYNVCKINVGTALRQVFGNTLREEILSKPEEFDRLKLFERPNQMLEQAAYEIISEMKGE